MTAGRRVVLVFLFAAVAAWTAPAVAQSKPQAEGCATCHLDGSPWR